MRIDGMEVAGGPQIAIKWWGDITWAEEANHRITTYSSELITVSYDGEFSAVFYHGKLITWHCHGELNDGPY